MFKKLFIFLLFSIGIFTVFLFFLNFAKINKTSKISLKKNVQSTIISKKNKMFFTYEQESIDKTNKIITIKLDGPENIMADAIDLRLDFNSNIKIEKIIEGDSFLSYPRKLIKDNYLLVTGTGVSEENKFLFAKPKTTFIQILLKIKTSHQKVSLKLNTQESKIFLSGNDITDQAGSFKQIDF